MKSTVRYFAICCAILGLSAPRARSAEPKTLEEALLNYTWEWTNAPKPPALIRFYADGTAGSWHWKITAARTAIVNTLFNKDGKPSTWSAELKFDETFSRLEGTAIDEGHRGHRYTGRRMKPVRNAESAPVSATTHKPDEPQIKILSDESVNVTGWITSPLDVAVPEQIWENLNFMKEALKDEAAQKPAATPAAYQLGVRLCLKMLENLAERDTATTRAGGSAVLHQKSNLTQDNRNHLTWPQFFLERDERAERKDNARKADRFMSGHSSVEWNNKTTNMRKEMQTLYSQFREALRQTPVTK